MINFENSGISNIVIHHVGNKFEGGGLTLSDGCFLPEDPDVVNLLKSYFLSAFKKAMRRFPRSSTMSLNFISNLSK